LLDGWLAGCSVATRARWMLDQWLLDGCSAIAARRPLDPCAPSAARRRRRRRRRAPRGPVEEGVMAAARCVACVRDGGAAQRCGAGGIRAGGSRPSPPGDACGLLLGGGTAAAAARARTVEDGVLAAARCLARARDGAAARRGGGGRPPRLAMLVVVLLGSLGPARCFRVFHMRVRAWPARSAMCGGGYRGAGGRGAGGRGGGGPPPPPPPGGRRPPPPSSSSGPILI